LEYRDTSTSTDDIPARAYTTTPGFSHLLGYVSYPKKDSSGIFGKKNISGKMELKKNTNPSSKVFPESE
jgi:hypothetical protein